MNSFAKNIITKGWLNISALYKGFVLPFFKYEIFKKRGGGGQTVLSSGYKEENLFRDLRTIKEDDVDLIKVYIDWSKNKQNYTKKIYAELIKKKIEVELIEKKLPKFNIEVEIIN
jgi:hypothetical protein